MKADRALALCIALFGLALLGACGQPKPATLPGYVEADYTRLASPTAGRLVSLKVSKGADVPSGAVLFELDQDQENAAIAEAAARLKHQDASAADLAKGKRQEEIAVLLAQAQQAQAQLALSESDLKRQRSLAASGFISGASLDSLEARRKADAAKLAEIEANLRVARMAARQDTRVAAAADIATAQAVLDQNQIRRQQKIISAPASGRVDDTFYREGEWVPAGAPVVSMLMPNALKLRFFVPQSLLPQFNVGNTIKARCDGCAEAFSARISYIAKSAEFNPPVIYSQENRARMVFMVEAIPDAPGKLSPGLPVDILLDAAP